MLIKRCGPCSGWHPVSTGCKESPAPNTRSVPKDVTHGEGEGRAPFSCGMATENIPIVCVSCWQCRGAGGAGDGCDQCWPCSTLCYQSCCCLGGRDKLLGLPLSSSQGFTLPCRKLLQNPSPPTGSPADCPHASLLHLPLTPVASSTTRCCGEPAQLSLAPAPSLSHSESAGRGRMATVDLQSTVNGISDMEPPQPCDTGDRGRMSCRHPWLQHL